MQAVQDLLEGNTNLGRGKRSRSNLASAYREDENEINGGRRGARNNK